MATQSLPFTQGGQTQLHKFRMLKQVSLSTIHIALWMGVLTWCVYYWLHAQHFLDILMLPAWGIAILFDQAPGVLSFVRKYCFFMEQGAFRHCTSTWFLTSPFCYQMVHRVLYHAIQGLHWAGGSSFLTIFVVLIYFLRKGRDLQATKQLAGFECVTFKQYLKRLKQLKIKKGVSLGDLTLPFDAEVKHLMITGTTGSGKTNAFNHLLNSIRTRGDRAVIVDTTGSFVSHFFDEHTDKLLNPFDKRSEEWCLWSECIHNLTDFDELAESLIPQANTHDTFWPRTARQAFAACASVLAQKKEYSLSKLLYVALKSKLDHASRLLKDTAVSSYFSKESEKTAMSIRATLASHIKCLEALTDIAPTHEKAFSIDSWVKEADKGFLFLHTKPKQRTFLKPLLSAWFSLAVKALMDLKPDSNRRIWFIVDELASLHQLSTLDTALAEARKYGGCFVIGFQNLSQIEDIYNPTVAKVLSDLTVSKLIFETVDPMNARRFSEMLGEQEVLESSETVSSGANEIRDGVSFSHQKRFQPLVRAADIMQLKPLNCYAKIANLDCVFKHEFAYLNLPVRANDFEDKDVEVLTYSGAHENTGKDEDVQSSKSDTSDIVEEETDIENKIDAEGIYHKNVSMKFKLSGLKLEKCGNTPEKGDERCDNDEETEDEEVCGKMRIAFSS
jgi:type IV conjugative transfer system coupling protein TraD